MILYLWHCLDIFLCIVATNLHIHRVERSSKAVSDLSHLLDESSLLFLLVMGDLLSFDNVWLLFKSHALLAQKCFALGSELLSIDRAVLWQMPGYACKLANELNWLQLFVDPIGNRSGGNYALVSEIASHHLFLRL